METRLSDTGSTEEEVERAQGEWWRSLVRCNPFYLLSPLLLVYGLYRVAVDPFFMKRDMMQLLFSFGSLEVYGAMLVITAIFLARRGIWYESTLLLFLQNLLVLIPFMLVSHAVFMGNGLSWSICTISLILAGAKFGAFQRFFPGLHLPGRLLVLGAVVLCVNVTLPLLFRRGMEADIEIWGVRRDYFWLVVLPVLVWLGNLLPMGWRFGEEPRREHERAWIPVASYLLWVLGTAVHLYIIDYVDDRPVTGSNLVVLAWSVAWLVALRFQDFLETAEPTPEQRNGFLLVVAIVTLGSFAVGPAFAVTLHLLNACILGMVALRNRLKMDAVLAGISALLALFAVPEETMRGFIPGYNLEKVACGLLLAVGFGVSLRNRTAKGGLLGAVCALALVLWALHGRPWGAHAAVQVFALYFIGHSLFWNAAVEEAGQYAVRGLVALGWAYDCVLLQTGAATAWIGYLLPLAMLGLAAIGWFVLRSPMWAVAGAGMLALVALPIFRAGLWLKAAPMGILAIAGGFALFAAETYFALRRRGTEVPG